MVTILTTLSTTTYLALFFILIAYLEGLLFETALDFTLPAAVNRSRRLCRIQKSGLSE